MAVHVGQLAASVRGTDHPAQHLCNLAAVGFTPAVLHEPQPSIEVGILGGA